MASMDAQLKIALFGFNQTSSSRTTTTTRTTTSAAGGGGRPGRFWAEAPLAILAEAP
jgi:hypothetical protein